MSEELKPCPFCGGEAVKNSCAVAECKSCRSPVGCRACSIWKDSIDEWNTRVDDDENLSQYLGDLIDWELRDRWTGEAFNPTSKIGEQR